jgi:hypothetical protein
MSYLKVAQQIVSVAQKLKGLEPWNLNIDDSPIREHGTNELQ